MTAAASELRSPLASDAASPLIGIAELDSGPLPEGVATAVAVADAATAAAAAATEYCELTNCCWFVGDVVVDDAVVGVAALPIVVSR